MWPSSVASLGRVTHAPADSTLYRATMRGQLLHPSGAAPGFDGVGSIRHCSQNFLRRWGGLRNFLSGAGGEGGGAAGGSPGCGRPCDHQRQVPAGLCTRTWRCPRSSSSTEWWTFPLCSSDVYPQCKLCRRPARSHSCSSSWTRLMTPVVVRRQVPVRDRAENCGGSAVAVL